MSRPTMKKELNLLNGLTQVSLWQFDTKLTYKS